MFFWDPIWVAWSHGLLKILADRGLTTTPAAAPGAVTSPAATTPATTTAPAAPAPNVLIQTRTSLTPAAPAAPAAAPVTQAPVPQPQTPAPAPATYTIKAGDTFSSIASAQFGDEKHWTAIAQANPLVDPTRLKIGQVIRLPDLKSFAQQRNQQLEQIRAVVGTGQRDGEVLVQPGDTLSHIADRVYGKSSLWPVIFRANRDILEGPDDVKPGMKLRIPPKP